MKIIAANIMKKLATSFSQQKLVTSVLRNQLDKIQQEAFVEYKRYPYLPHQDPSSKEYIHSELDEYHERTQVEEFNSIIDQLKNDLKVQREVWSAIDKLERTYKKGIPGVETNISSPVAKPYLQDLGFERRDVLNEDLVLVPRNEDSFIANTPFESKWKTSNVKEWQQQILNRPVTRHFTDIKGYKYDVPVKPEEKYEYLADRLGHPEFLGSPLERLLKLENDIYHPEYLDQPFVKLPNLKPHQSLNFERGQVVYQNSRVTEWLKFWQSSIFVFSAFTFLFVPYQLTFKTHFVTDLASQISWLAYHSVSPYGMDTYKLGVPIIAGSSGYVVYCAMNIANRLTNNYVTKLTLSKDKELLFATRIDLHGVAYEQVYEMAHLEILPPSVKSGVSDLSSQDEDGIWTVTCMNTRKELLIYNNPNFWNPHVRAQFFKRTMNLWDKSYYGYNKKEEAELNKNWQDYISSTVNQKKLPN